jgi:SAM-dependent methyltransferase
MLPTGIDRIIREAKRYGVKEGANILDCGSGPGKVAAFLSDSFNTKSVFGLDINADELKVSAIPNVMLANMDTGRKLPFKDSSFDLVFCNHVIEHLLDPDNLLDEVSRVLKNDGVFVVTTPNLAAWYNRIILLLGYQPHFTEVSNKNNVGKLYCGKLAEEKEGAIGGHLRIFTYPALKELIALHGFSVKNSFSYGHPYLLNSGIVGIFERLSQLSRSLASTLCFICCKTGGSLKT